jgi:hypothetical protein
MRLKFTEEFDEEFAEAASEDRTTLYGDESNKYLFVNRDTSPYWLGTFTRADARKAVRLSHNAIDFIEELEFLGNFGTSSDDSAVDRLTETYPVITTGLENIYRFFKSSESDRRGPEE